jgi:plastocyanin
LVPAEAWRRSQQVARSPAGAAISTLGAAVVLLAIGLSHGSQPAAAAQPAARGTIKGHVRLVGNIPGNPQIRMGMDPKCSQANAGRRVVQEIVAATADGSLGNVFVKLQGSFPATPVPNDPITIDQHGCVYSPRVAGVRVGQALQIRNSDALMHNVHGLSDRGNDFNVSEPSAGMVQAFHLKSDESMLKIKCDIHSWMTAFVGVVSHPYFAVSTPQGGFEIANVPAGTQTIEAWHERFGTLTQTVRVKPGTTTTVEFSYEGGAKPKAGAH